MDTLHYIRINCMFGYKFLVIDTEQRLWLKALSTRNISYKVITTRAKDKCPYIVMIIRISRRDKVFLPDIALRVEDNMSLTGYNNYPDFRNKLLNELSK